MSYTENRQIILQEITHALEEVPEADVVLLTDVLCNAERIFAVGVGRVLLMLQAFVKRLNHLGLRATYVGAIDEPAITEHDVLLVGSSSGESVFPLSIVRLAKKYGAKIVHIGANPTSSMAEYEDVFIRLRCRTKFYLPDEIVSKQPMSSLFEQSLLLLLDSVAMNIIERQEITDLHTLWKYHANLE